MSHLQRSFAKAKLAALPFDPPLPIQGNEDFDDIDQEDDQFDNCTPSPDPAQDDDSSSSSSASSASSTATIIPSHTNNLFARPK